MTEITFDPHGSNLVVTPVFTYACWGYVSVELINEKFYTLRAYDVMSHETVHSLHLPSPDALRDLQFFGIDATFTLDSPDKVQGVLNIYQDGQILGTACTPVLPSAGGISRTLRVHCVPRIVNGQ